MIFTLLLNRALSAATDYKYNLNELYYYLERSCHLVSLKNQVLNHLQGSHSNIHCELYSPRDPTTQHIISRQINITNERCSK